MFYIRPPVGSVIFPILEKCVDTRLWYFDYLDSHNEHVGFYGDPKYLLENSEYDYMGHFTLRLIAAMRVDFRVYWLKKEVLFLNQRLKVLSDSQLVEFFTRIVSDMDTASNEKTILDKTVRHVCFFYLEQIVGIRNSRLNERTERSCEVPFEFLIDLVSTRNVELMNGYAILQSCHCVEATVALFSMYLSEKVKYLESSSTIIIDNHELLSALCERILLYVSKGTDIPDHVTVENVDIKARNFPPCMHNLHKKLRDEHRLTHYARVCYTRFLKDVGMDCRNATNFWQNEYSKPSTCNATCIDKWHTKEKRYLYSIRHIYGLEGCKRESHASNCEKMCERVTTANYEGGCPFQHFEPDSLKNLLSNFMTVDEIEQFSENSKNETPQQRCAQFFKVTSNCHDDVIITHPQQFYKMKITISNGNTN